LSVLLFSVAAIEDVITKALKHLAGVLDPGRGHLLTPSLLALVQNLCRRYLRFWFGLPEGRGIPGIFDGSLGCWLLDITFGFLKIIMLDSPCTYKCLSVILELLNVKIFKNKN
jgi:hypothetical protein